MHATLATEAAFLVSAEGRSGVELIVSVRPHHACAQLRYHLENLAAFVGPDAGTESIGCVIRALDGLDRKSVV